MRFAYDNRFNPGGGWKIQGDRVVSYWKKLEGVSSVDSSGSAFAAKSLMWPVSGGHVTQEAHEGHMATDIGVVKNETKIEGTIGRTSCLRETSLIRKRRSQRRSN